MNKLFCTQGVLYMKQIYRQAKRAHRRYANLINLYQNTLPFWHLNPLNDIENISSRISAYKGLYFAEISLLAEGTFPSIRPSSHVVGKNEPAIEMITLLRLFSRNDSSKLGHLIFVVYEKLKFNWNFMNIFYEKKKEKRKSN